MTYNFFANEQDKIDLLNFIFNDTSLQIFDSASLYDEEVAEYKSVQDITKKFDLRTGDSYACTFQLWSPNFKGELIFEKVNLDPKRCKGHSFRFHTRGWGLIQLYFGGLQNEILSHSHIGHFNHKGALSKELPNSVNGRADDWDWQTIAKASNKLKYHLHNKLAVKKKGACGVLKGAEMLEASGIKLW